MVEITPTQAFLDMLAWSEELDNGRQNQKSWLWRYCRRRAIYWLLRSSSQPVAAKPKTQINRRWRYQLLSRWWDAYRKKPFERLLSEKSGRCGRSRLRSVALYLWLIVVISVRQLTCCGNIWASLPCWLYCPSIRLDSLRSKFKEAGGTVREIDVWAESPRLSPLWLSASSSACHGLLIITVIITYKAQRDKNARELKSANAALRHADASAWCCCADAKYTVELADAKAGTMLCVMMLPLVVVGCTSAQSVRPCVKPPPPLRRG